MGIFGKGPDTKPSEPGPRPAPTPPAVSLAAAKPCVIGAKTLVKGELGGDEDVVVEGTVEGQIRIGKNLLVAQGGSVKADVSAHSVVLAGELTGDCSASHKVEITATGRLTGNIRAPKIVIAEGAVFKGNSDMSGRNEEPRERPAAGSVS